MTGLLSKMVSVEACYFSLVVVEEDAIKIYGDISPISAGLDSFDLHFNIVEPLIGELETAGR